MSFENHLLLQYAGLAGQVHEQQAEGERKNTLRVERPRTQLQTASQSEWKTPIAHTKPC